MPLTRKPRTVMTVMSRGEIISRFRDERIGFKVLLDGAIDAIDKELDQVRSLAQQAIDDNATQDVLIQKNTTQLKCLRGLINNVAETVAPDSFDLESEPVNDTTPSRPHYLTDNLKSRIGHAWTDAEEQWLKVTFRTAMLEALAEDHAFKNYPVVKHNVLKMMAALCGRTAHALSCRLEQLGYEMGY